MPELIQQVLTLGNALKIPETRFEIDGREIYYDQVYRCYWVTATHFLEVPPQDFATIEDALNEVLSPFVALATQLTGANNGTQ